MIEMRGLYNGTDLAENLKIKKLNSPTPSRIGHKNLDQVKRVHCTNV